MNKLGVFIQILLLAVITPVYSQDKSTLPLPSDFTGYDPGIIPILDTLTNTSSFILPTLEQTNLNTNISYKTNAIKQTLFDAVTNNDRELLADLLKENANPNIRDFHYRSPLMYATDESLDIVRLLLANNASLNTRDSSGDTILIIATKNGDIELVRLLLEYNVLINTKNREGLTALHYAIQKGYTDIAILLTDHSANIHFPFPNGLEPIFEATKNGYAAIVKHLIQRGANPNHFMQSTGTSLLSIASAFGLESTVLVLLDAGANPNLPNKLGITPIFLSISKQHHNITEILLEHGASTHIKSKDGLTLKDITIKTDSTTLKLLQKYKNNK